MFVAVVTQQDPLKSGRPESDLSCFVAETKDEAVAKAVSAKQRWEGPHGRFEGDAAKTLKLYRVLVGELTEEAKVPISLVKLGAIEF